MSEITPEVKNAHKGRRIFERLRTHIAPNIFTGACAFDGKKNLFAINIAPVNGTYTVCIFIGICLILTSFIDLQFDVNMSDVPQISAGASRAIYQFTLTSVGVISPEYECICTLYSRLLTRPH